MVHTINDNDVRLRAGANADREFSDLLRDLLRSHVLRHLKRDVIGLIDNIKYYNLTCNYRDLYL